MLKGSFAFLLLTGALAGCVLHMDGIVPASVFDDRLLGTWIGGNDTRAVVTRRGAAEYDVFYSERADTVTFRAARGDIGGRAILEIRPAAASVVDGWPTAGMILVISVNGDSAMTHLIDTDSLRSAFERDGSTAFFEQGGSLVLTGDARAMSAMLRTYLRAPGVLRPGQPWRRLRR